MENTASTIKYTYISQLDDIETLSADDLFVVSHLSNKTDDEYESLKLSYGTLSSTIYDSIQSSMTSLTDAELSCGLNQLSSTITSLSNLLDICVSAIVALDNCRNGVRSRLDNVEVRLNTAEADIAELKQRI